MRYLKVSSPVQHPRVGSDTSKKTEENQMQGTLFINMPYISVFKEGNVT
jgi:hypothetical protein